MIYIACPVRAITGGPTLAHQMCHELRAAGVSAKMYYYETDGRFAVWEDFSDSPYAIYDVSAASESAEVDQPGNHILLPEMAVPLRKGFSRAYVHIWWMSVDGYLLSLVNGMERLTEDVAFFKSDRVMHFAQSQYAYEYLTRDMQIPEERVMVLTDYIDERYLVETDLSSGARENYVYYNYTKRGDELPVIIERHPEIRWFPIRNMTVDEIVDAFHRGKVYVDFGFHPGKDRIPREAASCGLCVITNRRGSAAYQEDVPIPDEYKFMSPLEEEEKLLLQIEKCFDEYDTKVMDFSEYRRWIREEKVRFQQEAAGVADRLLKMGYDDSY